MYIDYEFVERFVENIAALLGDKCEIVIHDFTEGYDETIVKIVNGHVSGRTVGNPPTNLFFEIIADQEATSKDLPIYFTTTPSGAIIKSSTTFIRNKRQTIIGAICINLDITDLVQSQEYMEKFTGYSRGEAPRSGELYAQSLGEIVEHYLKRVEEQIGKPAHEMNKKEKMRALAFLDEKGILQMAKANVRLCEFFNISKYTLYNYLDTIRNKGIANAETDQEEE